ncbi:metal-dependent hydrolase [Haloferax larsenii]|uniref:LexA-binding, inner membrane-associated putative hydrolase n=1 Tax=Haloferax larsenii TaxID=302484 RepID=A0A1H7V3Q7_HALLR|nr:metal-dependent hydrolase [Haloferax larsenii]SEM03367.1 LexA-binding, inner membrane-associated putative hydrolase [Haloferax larsenii]
MWPWEHLLFGYIWYSILNRALWRTPITDGIGLTIALSTQAPDLVDKPLSWTLGLVTSGYGPAHSLLLGLPAVLVVAGLAWTRDKARVGVALVVGYSSHLVGDVLALRANGPIVGRVLWPLVTYEPYPSDLGFLERFAVYLVTFVAQMTAPENTVLVLGYVTLCGAVAVLWILDGTPGIRWARRIVTTSH